MSITNSILIRAAEDKDTTAVQSLLVELGYAPGENQSFEKTWKQILSSPNMGILVADTGRIAGYLAYSFKPQLRLDGFSMEIDELCVSTNYRGQGIGTHLLNEAKDLANSLGIKRMVLSTNRERESYKQGFYLKNGFQEKKSALLELTLSDVF